MNEPPRTPAARWCGYCQRGIADCVCPPWMPNTGTEKERAERAIRTGWIEQMTLQARSRTVAVAARIDCQRCADAELLDWLDANNGAWMSDEKCLWHGEWPKRRAVHAATLREAIRAASLATPE